MYIIVSNGRHTDFLYHEEESFGQDLRAYLQLGYTITEAEGLADVTLDPEAHVEIASAVQQHGEDAVNAARTLPGDWKLWLEQYQGAFDDAEDFAWNMVQDDVPRHLTEFFDFAKYAEALQESYQYIEIDTAPGLFVFRR